VLETCCSFATKLTSLDAHDDKMSGVGHRLPASLQDGVDDRINEAGVHNAAPGRSTVLCC